MNSVRPSGPPKPAREAEQVEGNPLHDPPLSRTLTQPRGGAHHTAPSASVQMPSTPSSSGAHTRRFDRLMSEPMSHAPGRDANDSATMSIEAAAVTAMPFGSAAPIGNESALAIRPHQGDDAGSGPDFDVESLGSRRPTVRVSRRRGPRHRHPLRTGWACLCHRLGRPGGDARRTPAAIRSGASDGPALPRGAPPCTPACAGRPCGHGRVASMRTTTVSSSPTTAPSPR